MTEKPVGAKYFKYFCVYCKKKPKKIYKKVFVCVTFAFGLTTSLGLSFEYCLKL